jgi:hypothetical protein
MSSQVCPFHAASSLWRSVQLVTIGPEIMVLPWHVSSCWNRHAEKASMQQTCPHAGPDCRPLTGRRRTRVRVTASKPFLTCRRKRTETPPGEAELVRGWRRRGRPRRRSRRGGPKGREICALKLQVHVDSIAQHGQTDESKESVGQTQQSPARVALVFGWVCSHMIQR